jgi:CBS domain-containing protein
MELNNSNSATDRDEALGKKEAVTSLYRYSDLSINNIAQQVNMPANEVQQITDKLLKLDAARLFEQESTAKIEKIMSTNVVSLDVSKTAAEAAALMTEKKVGSVIVTKNNKPLKNKIRKLPIVDENKVVTGKLQQT